MATNLPPVPFQTPIADASGMLSRVWADWFLKAQERMGGNLAETNGELYSVETARLDNSAVTTDKISDLAVTTAKIANGAVSFAKQLSTDWTSSQASSGSTKLPNGMYVKWGVTASLASSTATTITFGSAFPTNCFQVVVSVRDNSAGATVATGHFGSGNYTASGFDLYNRTSAAYVFNWIAIGN
jgi:hypothetical protein